MMQILLCIFCFVLAAISFLTSYFALKGKNIPVVQGIGLMRGFIYFGTGFVILGIATLVSIVSQI